MTLGPRIIEIAVHSMVYSICVKPLIMEKSTKAKIGIPPEYFEFNLKNWKFRQKVFLRIQNHQEMHTIT